MYFCPFSFGHLLSNLHRFTASDDPFWYIQTFLKETVAATCCLLRKAM